MRNLSFVKMMTAPAMALMFLVASNITRVEATPANNLTPEESTLISRIFSHNCSNERGHSSKSKTARQRRVI